MRKLKTMDVFSAMRLIKASGMRDEVQRIALAVKNNKKMTMEDVGSDFILGVFEGLASVGAEQKVYEFLSGPFEMTIDEIKDLEVMELISLIKEFKNIEDAESWKHFFDSVASLMK